MIKSTDTTRKIGRKSQFLFKMSYGYSWDKFPCFFDCLLESLVNRKNAVFYVNIVTKMFTSLLHRTIVYHMR